MTTLHFSFLQIYLHITQTSHHPRPRPGVLFSNSTHLTIMVYESVEFKSSTSTNSALSGEAPLRPAAASSARTCRALDAAGPAAVWTAPAAALGPPPARDEAAGSRSGPERRACLVGGQDAS